MEMQNYTTKQLILCLSILSIFNFRFHYIILSASLFYIKHRAIPVYLKQRTFMFRITKPNCFILNSFVPDKLRFGQIRDHRFFVQTSNSILSVFEVTINLLGFRA